MNKPVTVATGIAVIALLLIFSTTYTVRYNEVAVKTTFGGITASSVVTRPGLHFRWPIFIDKVHPLDTRLQLVESSLEEIATADGLQLVVRAFLLWRVDTGHEDGPLEFFRRFRSVDGALPQVDSAFRSAFTGGLSAFRFNDLIGPESRLTEAEDAIVRTLDGTLRAMGIEPVAVGISQVLYPPRTSRAVVERMKASRDVIGDSERTRGTAEASRLRAEASTRAEIIRAFTVQRQEEIRAQGNLQSAGYLAQMSQDEELAVFLLQLDMIRKSLESETTFVVPVDRAPWFLLQGPPSGAVSPAAAAPSRSE